MSETETGAMERLLAISREAAERQTELQQQTAGELRAMILMMKEELELFRESRQLLEEFISGIDRPIQQLTKSTAALIQLYQMQRGEYDQTHQ